VHYRATLERAPTEANLRRARLQLQGIKERIAHETFSFAEEFPGFPFSKHIGSVTAARTCDDVFDEFLGHVESRVAKHDLAFASADGYRKILENVWRPKIGKRLFSAVRYSELMKIADAPAKSKKTHNNVISALRCAFDYGYRDTPEKHNPATGLKCLRITKKDRPVIDPFSIQEAEALIAAIHREWGEAQGNYDEFRLFTGLRPSEQIALLAQEVRSRRSAARPKTMCGLAEALPSGSSVFASAPNIGRCARMES
jgi:integrase